MQQDMIVILDLGSEQNTLIARDIRSLGVYTEIHPHDITADQLGALPNVRGVILNGGPNRVEMCIRDRFILIHKETVGRYAKQLCQIVKHHQTRQRQATFNLCNMMRRFIHLLRQLGLGHPRLFPEVFYPFPNVVKIHVHSLTQPSLILTRLVCLSFWPH